MLQEKKKKISTTYNEMFVSSEYSTMLKLVPDKPKLMLNYSRCSTIVPILRSVHLCKMHPIFCPHWQAMRCLFWGFGRKVTVIRALHTVVQSTMRPKNYAYICCLYLVVFCFESFYIYPSGLPHWHWVNCMTATMTSVREVTREDMDAFKSYQHKCNKEQYIYIYTHKHIYCICGRCQCSPTVQWCGPFCNLRFRVSTLQANNNKPFIISNRKHVW